MIEKVGHDKKLLKASGRRARSPEGRERGGRAGGAVAVVDVHDGDAGRAGGKAARERRAPALGHAVAYRRRNREYGLGGEAAEHARERGVKPRAHDDNVSLVDLVPGGFDAPEARDPAVFK